MLKTIEEMREALGGLWTEEFGEIEITIHESLTEPVCPSATLYTEKLRDGPYFKAHGDTVEGAVAIVVTAAYMTLIERKPKPETVPWSEKNEHENVTAFLAALDKRKASA